MLKYNNRNYSRDVVISGRRQYAVLCTAQGLKKPFLCPQGRVAPDAGRMRSHATHGPVTANSWLGRVVFWTFLGPDLCTTERGPAAHAVLDVNIGQNYGQIRIHDSHDQPVNHCKTVVARFRKLFIETWRLSVTEIINYLRLYGIKPACNLTENFKSKNPTN